MNNTPNSKLFTIHSNKKSMNTNSTINVSISLLDETSYDIQIDTKNSIGDLFQKICEKLNLKEYDIFGLAQKQKNGYHFLNNEDKIIKYVSSGKPSNSEKNSNSSSLSSFGLNKQNLTSTLSLASSSSSSNGSSLASRLIHNLNENLINFSFHSNSYYLKNCKTINDEMLVTYKRFDSLNSKYLNLPNEYAHYSLSRQSPHETDSINQQTSIQLYFRVKFYVSDPLLLTSVSTRYLYYLQLRQNYLNIHHKLTEERYFELASLAIVADFGVYDSKVHCGRYFNLDLYFPSWIISKLGSSFIYKNMPLLHSKTSYMNAITAQNKFIHELCHEECPYNFHLYNLYKNKEETPGTIGLGIAPKGILVFDLRNQNEIRLISTFCWSSVTKLNFHKKKFEVLIRIECKLRRYTYFTNCEKFSKYLLDLSRLTHAFTINVFERLADQKTLANYVNESYSEKMQALSHNFEETYEEREIIEQNEKIFENEEMSQKKIDINNNNVMTTTNSSIINTIMSSSSSTSSSSSLNCAEVAQSASNHESICNDTLCNYSIQFMRTKEIDSLPICSEDKIENLTQLLKTQSFRSELNFNNNKKNNNNDVSIVSNNSINPIENQAITDPIASSFPLKEAEMAMNLHPTSNSQYSKISPFSAVANTMNPVNYFNPSFGLNADQLNHSANRSLNYRQTFSTGSTAINPSSFMMNTFSGSSSPVVHKLRSKRSYLPPPPLPSSAAYTTLTTMNQVNQPFSFMPQSYFSETNLPLASVTDYTATLNDSNNLFRKEFQNDLFIKSHSTNLTSFMYKNINSNDQSNTLSSSSSSSSSSTSTNSRYSPSFQPPYIKYKKPPSYEESLRKIRKNSNQSSTSSLFNEGDTESNGSKSQSSFHHQRPLSSINQSNDHIQNVNESLTIDNNMLIEQDLNETNTTDNTIALSIENLEQIRMKAASMSLPLLTALCSDTSLIRSLNMTKQEGSF